MDDAAYEARAEVAREAFGSMLRRWRKQQGWTQYTACKWAKEAGFSAISYGNLSVIEQGKAGELRHKAFWQLAEINRRLATGEYGAISDAKLRALVKAAQPLADHEGGAPWDEVAFWSCYVGIKPVPERYSQDLLPELDQRTCKMLLKRWRKRFQQLAASCEFRPSYLLEQLVDRAPAALRDRLEVALLGAAELDPEEFKLLYDAKSEGWLIEQWFEQLAEQEKSPSP